MEMLSPKSLIKYFGVIPVTAMIVHLWCYRIWGEGNDKIFFVSLYLWLWTCSLNGLKDAKTNLKRGFYAIQVAVAFNFASMEYYGSPDNEWTKREWAGTIVSCVHGLLVLFHCLLHKKYWYQLFLLSIKEYFYKIKSCITKHHKYK